ncbi:MAG: T9SS type A sorting domain-containing protein [Candidatus Cloacimonetes bacterium]|nr:T9SS type A sorting domain-containing protein [Candidatus Cloacimonadota bacterium]
MVAPGLTWDISAIIDDGPTDTYTLSITSDPVGTLLKDGVSVGTTPYELVLDNAAGHYGTYSMDPVAGGTWSADLVIDETTVWPSVQRADYEIEHQFLWTADADTYQYKLTLNSPVPGDYAFGGPATGTTGVQMISDVLTEAVNPYLGTYTITAPCPVDYYEWLPLEVLAGDFALQTKGKNGAAFGQRANGSKALLVYVGEKDFAMQAIDYTFEFTGLPAGATINGGTVFTFTGTAAELFAMTFDILAPGFEPILGYVITPATLLDGGDEIVMDPIVDTWTLNVISTPEGQEIWKNNVYTGFVTPHAFTNEDQTALYGTYTLPVVAGFVWCPPEHIVNVDTWNTKADYPATIEFLQQQIYTWTVLVLDLNTSSPIEGASIWFDDGVNPPTVVATTIVNGTYTFTCPGDYPGAGTYYVTATGYNVWDPINVVQTVETMTENLPNSTFYGDWEDQVPVELSSFTATLTGQFYVQLSWTSQTETQMMGYRVYRNTSAQQSSSELIVNPMIPATNTSTTQNYTVVDEDVLIGQTYYYWLEAVDYNSSSFHGPVSVTVTGNVPPVLPEVTTMRNAYPNPFKANGSTNIEVSLKAGDTGTLTIYNVQGQAVKTVSLTEGNHMVSWNGRDTRGNACGSGIYFYKLSTQSMNQTKKMVIVK